MEFKSKADKKRFIEKVQEQRGKLPEFEKILNLMKRGMSQSQIAKKYDVSRQSVNNKIRKELKKSDS